MVEVRRRSRGLGFLISWLSSQVGRLTQPDIRNMTEYDKTQGNMPWPVKREVQKRIVHSGGQYWPVKAWLVKRYSFSPLPFKGRWTPFVPLFLSEESWAVLWPVYALGSVWCWRWQDLVMSDAEGARGGKNPARGENSSIIKASLQHAQPNRNPRLYHFYDGLYLSPIYGEDLLQKIHN